MGSLIANTVQAPWDSIAGARQSWDQVGNYISTISGAISEGSQIEVTGIGFGSSGPTIHLFEDFSGGVNNTEVTTANTGFDFIPGGSATMAAPYFTSDARSGSLGCDIYRADTVPRLNATPMRCNFATATNEIFVSYALKCPDGSKWPGNGVAEEDWGSDANYKFFWLIDTAIGSGENDLILCSNVVNTFNTHGNGLPMTGGDTVPISWWAWDVWNRFTFWVKADPDNPSTVAGTLYTQIINASGYNHQTMTPTIFGGGIAPYTWNQGSIAAWARDTATDSGRKVLLDDFYLAVGANAAARVELGNNATYTSCTKLAMCEVSGWTNTALQVTIHAGDLDLTAATWMFITLPNNTSRISKQVVTP